jgi:hypothetical protein
LPGGSTGWVEGTKIPGSDRRMGLRPGKSNGGGKIGVTVRWN